MLAALVLTVALPTLTPSPVPSGEALIVKSGSTNLAGYRLRVFADGRVVLEQGSTAEKRVPPELAIRFFGDLRAAGPLDRLPQSHCMKSASFGSSMRIAYRGRTSPDISCPNFATATRALARDAGALADAAGIRARFRSALRFQEQ